MADRKLPRVKYETDDSGCGRLTIDGKDVPELAGVRLEHDDPGHPPRVVATVNGLGGMTFEADAYVEINVMPFPDHRVVAVRKSDTVTEYRVRRDG